MPNPSPLARRLRTSRPRIVEKPWGREVIYAAAERFAGKLLEVRGGARLSLHVHARKHETFYVQRGAAILWAGDTPETLESVRLGPGDTVDLPPGVVHRLEAVVDCVLLEASSPELDDLIRLDDDYGRHRPD